MSEWQERNDKVIAEFHANGGKVEGWAQLILLTIKGAKTGKRYVTPLMYVPDGDRILAVASKGGYPTHPVWYKNLLVNPDVTVEVGTEKFETVARILTGEERAEAYAKAEKVFPPYAEYKTKTDREIPVIALDRPKK
ncbi:nitroreductase family deazaflavin-dependent oxidoreductase [Dictyobacter arantiisoli]|uniref:Nitroreductase n=1 Tax=Dictyobacter arantiisoli TaxID=2014874 RepID=A0A5A5TI14_9CHLR|nr:nitroreductase family deazaflavin-dependent oxidoreductase [Dictyobacter arantiisoli]GCF10952.1 hypothetical protein KDI_45160 [Dictyobacter arantiisoli]